MPTLKEFDLDIPYKSNQGSRDDYEMNWKDKRLKFSNEVRCICSLYEQNFEKIRTDECWKVLVECVETVTDYRVRCYGGVCHICIPLDINRYFSLENLEKKKIILSVLKQGIDRVVEEKKWDKAPFEHAYQNVISKGYINQWTWKKPKKSPDRKYSAEVFCTHEIDEFSIWIIIKNSYGVEVNRKKIIREVPNEWDFAEHLGKLTWQNAREVALINKNDTQRWIVEVPVSH
ncbi:hypothetical protein O9H85_27195 [Paenibacillus filicis]|uniref:Uncharacterized protein n=1 Tax=Paenibacillus gyeongsangnamensis TaxID=3388067 RepID=A0ABT4QGV5_9BACL|nr:hypothetical protein [Paenibacillus filicis]MCZ8516022.1 hypothetical protein [Paenibacillus filicis]